MLPADTGESGAVDGYDIVSQLSTFKVNPNNTTTAIEQITFRSAKYDVTATFNMTRARYLQVDPETEVALRVGQVNQLAGHEHVVSVRGEEDQGLDGNLYNYLVVTVGTQDGERTDDVRIRMDSIGLPSAFAAVDAAWVRMNKLGAVV